MRLTRDVRPTCKRSRHRRRAGWFRSMAPARRDSRDFDSFSGAHPIAQTDGARSGARETFRRSRPATGRGRARRATRSATHAASLARSHEQQRDSDRPRPGHFQQYRRACRAARPRGPHSSESVRCRDALRQVAQHGSREFRRKAEDDELVQAPMGARGVAVRRNPGLCGHRHDVPTLRAHAATTMDEIVCLFAHTVPHTASGGTEALA